MACQFRDCIIDQIGCLLRIAQHKQRRPPMDGVERRPLLHRLLIETRVDPVNLLGLHKPPGELQLLVV